MTYTNIADTSLEKDQASVEYDSYNFFEITNSLSLLRTL